MSARIQKAFLLSLALIAGLLILLGSSWLLRKVTYPVSGPGSGLLAQYYANTDFRGPVKRQWVERRTSLKATALSPERVHEYSLRFTGILYITVPGYYQLGTASDDDSRLSLDGLLLVDNHGEHPLQLRMAGVWLAPGPHFFEADYVQRGGDAALQFWWQPFWASSPSLLPQASLKPITKPLGHLDVVELSHAARIRCAQIAAVLLIVWVLLAAGLWSPGGWRRVLALYLATVPITIWSIIPQMSLDLWCDELVSLAMYSIRPLSATIGEYSYTNNHIFYNVINNLFLRLTGSHDLGQVMSAPFALRLLSLGYCIVALAWLYRAMLRRFNFEAAWLATLILATTLPFASFTTQLRGYSLCILLAVIMLDMWLRFFERPSAWTGLGMALINTALMWALPANACLSLSMILIMIPLLWLPHRRRHALQAGIWLATGLVWGVHLYLPVWNQVLEHGSTPGLFSQAGVLRVLMPKVWGHLLTGRYLLVPGLIVGAWLLFKRTTPERWPVLGAAGLLILPFLVFWVYGVWPYQRIFIILVIPWSAAAGILLAAPLKLCAWGARLRWSWLGLIFLICVGSYLWSLSAWRINVEMANVSGRTVQNLSYAYYLHLFEPRQTILKVLGQEECPESGRFVYGMDLRDGGGLYEYANYMGVNLSNDRQTAQEIMDRRGCLYMVWRGKIITHKVPPGEKAVLTPLNSRYEFYHLYRWGP